MTLKRTSIPFLLAVLSLPLIATFCPPPTSGGDGGTTPTNPTGPTIVTQASVATSFNFSCYLSAQGSPNCWRNELDGFDSKYRVGTNAELFGGKKFASIDLGYDGGCALTGDDKVLCFGARKGGFEKKTPDELAMIKVAGANPRVFAGGEGRDTICTLSESGMILCYRDNGTGGDLPTEDLVALASNNASYGIKSDGGLVRWFNSSSPPSSTVFANPTSEIFLNSFSNDQYGCLLGTDKKVRCFKLPDDLPEFSPTLPAAPLRNVVVSAFGKICGINVADNLPLCFKEPEPDPAKFSELDAQQLSQKVFTKISLGGTNSDNMGCGIEASNKKLFCWRFSNEDAAFPKGVPASIEAK